MVSEIGLTVVILGLVWYIVRLRRQLRALGYCYLSLGDWALKQLVSARESNEFQFGKEHTPFVLLDAEKNFQAELLRHRRWFDEAGIDPPGDRERLFPVETI